MPKEPNPFFQLMKGLLYFGLFICCQVVTSTVLLFVYALEKGYADQAAGIALSSDSLMAYAQEKVQENINLFLILYTALFLVVLAIFFAIRKKNVLHEVQLKKFSPRFLPSLLLLVPGLFLFTNSALSLLPSFLVESYMAASSGLGKGTLLIALFTQAICAPLTEEITFRGLMLSRLNVSFPKWGGVLISSILFGVIHGNPVWFFYAALIGSVFCVVTNRTGSILATLLLHGLFNGLGTVISRFTIRISYQLVIACFILGLLLTVLGLWLLLRKEKTPKTSEV